MDWGPSRLAAKMYGSSAYQIYLAPPTVTPSKDLFLIPTGLAALSFVYLASSGVYHLFASRGSSKEDASNGTTNGEGGDLTQKERRGLKQLIEEYDGLTICALRFIQFLGILALIALSIVHIVYAGGYESGKARRTSWSLLAIYVYSSILSITTLISRPTIRDRTSTHVSSILFATFAVYFVLHIWPLAKTVPTWAEHVPKRTWGAIGVLTLVGFVIPAIMPRVFRPSYEGEVPRLDKTASLASRIGVSYMDHVIWKAAKVPDLKVNDLPELGHADRAAGLIERATAVVDPLAVKKRRHIFIHLVTFFWKETIMMFIWINLNSITQFISPWALKSLLGQLDGEFPSDFKPWFWILVLAFGPIIAANFNMNFFYYLLRSTVQQQSIVTQMVFNHALRLRLDATAGKKKTDGSSESGTVTPKDSKDKSRAPSSSSSSPPNGGTASQSNGADKKDGAKDEKKGSKKDDDEKSLAGKINNLIAADLNTMAEAPMVLTVPGALVQVAVAIYFLYSLLGWAAFVGLGTIIVCIPLPALVAKLSLSTEKTKMKMTDKRVQAVTETIGVLRMIKLFAWEGRVLEQLSQRRLDELKYIRRGKLLFIAMYVVQVSIPAIALVTTIASYTILMKKPYTPARAFASLAIFDIVRTQIFYVGHFLPQALKAKVAYDRLNGFLQADDVLLPEPAETTTGYTADVPKEAIGFNEASFSWHKEEDMAGDMTPSRRIFRLRSDVPVTFKHGAINIIVGPTGCGKTSMLMALLGEMHYNPYGPGSWVNLPREGGLAYAAQESWVLNETIRNNILFGLPYDEERYNKVLKQCGLERDLELWEAGDHTEVGEKGLTLSGGQKARVTLARAIYSQAEILLLDDVLAALDVHTAKSVVKDAFRGDLVAGRTVLLVTHNLALVSPIASHVVLLSKDGQVTGQGSVSEVLKMDTALQAEMEREQAMVEKADDEVAPAVDEEEKKKVGKLVVAEEKAMGRVSMKAIMLYIGGLGGPIVWVTVLVLDVIKVAWDISETAWISYWSGQYNKFPISEIPALKYIGVFAFIIVMQLSFVNLTEWYYIIASVRASQIVHTKLMKSIFGAPLRWLDTVPVGRITTRCTQDIQTVDGPFPDLLLALAQISISLIVLYCTSVVAAGWVAFISGLIVAATGAFLGNMYLKAQLSVRREMSNAKAPIMTQVSTALSGLVSIRAYAVQEPFKKDLGTKIDTSIRCSVVFQHLNRWIGIRSDALGGFFAGTVALYLVYGWSSSAAGVGFTLSIVAAFCRRILHWIRLYNFVEVQANSLERILDFVNVEQEPQAVEDRKPPAYWPASGDLRAEGLTARYADGSPDVLKELTFEIKSGERVGVVGRTGAGKSSLSLALLRAIKTSGKVYYNGIATDTINLQDLRSSITVIPQQPELLHGTVRDNLDPFNQYDDAQLNDALRAAGLFDLQGEPDEPSEDQATHVGSSSEADTASMSTKVGDESHKITLDSEVRGGGSNFSVGQRQIIALARAMLRRSKILILDEATAAIDYETDAVIQRFLRTELDRDTTVLTIAHRLQTIMDSDKIMVLDAGQLVEFDSPANLLQKESGLFKSLVNESNDKEVLIRMATGGSQA